uniref:Uncharacterized protein n=1 Tax=Anguilla anguilla TaxID=7936 RepID=A0A0E9XQK9_ANGAN
MGSTQRSIMCPPLLNHLLCQNDTYSLIPAVPASSKLPLPAQDDAHTAHHSATYSTLQMH